MLDTYVINGVDLRSLAWRIATAEGLQDVPEMRDTDIVLPGTHGVLDVEANPAAPRRRYGPGAITFRMWLVGVDPTTGLAPWDPDDLSVYNARLGELTRLFNARRLDIVHPRADGDRRAYAKLVGGLTPVREPASPWFGSIEASCVIPGAFWSGPADITASGTVTTGGVVDLSAFAACDAPIAGGLVDFGPGANPSFAQDGAFVAYDGVIAAGRRAVVDSAEWDVGPGAGAAWTPDRTKVRYSPGPAWFELDPTRDPLQAVLTHTGGGSMNVAVTGRPQYLTS